MDKIGTSATTAAKVNEMAYAPPPSTRPATVTTNPIRPEPGLDPTRLRMQERATLDTTRDTLYEPDRRYREQTFGARFGQVGVTLDVKA